MPRSAPDFTNISLTARSHTTKKLFFNVRFQINAEYKHIDNCNLIWINHKRKTSRHSLTKTNFFLLFNAQLFFSNCLSLSFPLQMSKKTQ